MTDVAWKHIGQAVSWIGEEIRRRQQFGIPIPPSLRETHVALTRALADPGQPDTPVLPRLKTARQIATEQRCSTRTARRRVKAAGGRKIDGLGWLIQED